MCSESDLNFKQLDNLNNTSDNYFFFNSTAWDIQNFVYGGIETKKFMSEVELLKCIKNLNSNN